MASSPDYPILGAPRISVRGFAAVLAANRSPAAGEAVACYNALDAAGVDPAVGLAIFRKESTFGRFGRAAHNRSWGNIRGAGAGYPLDSGRFRIYPSWSAGAADMARLLVVYGQNRIRAGTKTDTVQTLPYVWAPSSDGNAPDAYGDSLARWISEWSAKYPASGSGDPTGIPTSSPATPTSKTIAELFGIPASTVLTPPLIDSLIARLPSLGLSAELQAKIKGTLAEIAVGLTLNPTTITAGEISIDMTSGHAKGGGYDTGADPIAAVANAIAGIPAALGDVLIHGFVFLAILGLIAFGLYLVATSDD